MDGGLWHYTGGNDQNHFPKKKKKKSKKAKLLSEEALQIAVKEEKWKTKEKRKDIPFWMQSSKEEQRDKKAFLSD